jgi:hypothetical protein
MMMNAILADTHHLSNIRITKVEVLSRQSGRAAREFELQYRFPRTSRLPTSRFRCKSSNLFFGCYYRSFACERFQEVR